MTKIQAIRGMNDILPSETAQWQKIESHLRDIFHQYHYQEMRLPVVEKTELFKRGIGEATDIVEKEMYTFLDRNEESLTMRPEGTAGCVRAAIEHNLLYHQSQKLWYAGPMYRYERPQKGRYRQFYQVGIEAFGFAGYHIEAELIFMIARLFEKIGLKEKVTLQLNSLGTQACRLKYREAFVAYCRRHSETFDAEAKRRLEVNPLRLLDTKDPHLKEILKDAPSLKDYIDEASQQNFHRLCAILDEMHIVYEVNPHLVRGLDYYTGTVFEWVTPFLGAQSAVGAGGRYDGLVELLGGQPTPAVGLALGLERMVELCSEGMNIEPLDVTILFSESTLDSVMKLAERLRDALPALRIEVNMAGGSFKSQMKRADKSGARFALILGEDELKQNVITFKHLREANPQIKVPFDNIINHLRSVL